MLATLFLPAAAAAAVHNLEKEETSQKRERETERDAEFGTISRASEFFWFTVHR